MGFVSSPFDTRLWKVGGALYSEIDWKAMPIRPSGGNAPLANCGVYSVAAPNVCEHTYDIHASKLAENKTKGSTYSLSTNADIIRILLALHSGTFGTFVSKLELLSEIVRGRAGRWVIQRVPITV